MKVLLYTEGYKTISKSGLGKAIKHQIQALDDNNIAYTTNLKDDFDILHVNFYGPKSYFFAKKMRKKGKKIIYHAHSTEEDFRNSFLFSNLVAPLFKKWLCKCYKLGDYIVTPTEYSKKLLENYHLDRPIKAISNGIDTSFFEHDVKAGNAFRKKYGYTKKDKVIVGIGLYIERKGILDFVELAKRLPQYKFIWFGYSPLWASPRKIRKAVHTKLDNLVFAGYVDSTMIKSALSGADLYLFPTLEETEGIPVLEALTSKIPTLIRDIPIFDEYPTNQVVYKASNLDEFEEKIKLILNGKLPNLTDKGYEIAKKKDLKLVGQQLVATYNEVMSMERKEETKTFNKHQYFRSLSMILAMFILFITFLLKMNNFDKLNTLEVNKEYSREIEYMDTKINIKLYSSSPSKAKRALNEIENIYKEYDALTDRDNKDSDIYKIYHNTLKDDKIKIDHKLYNLIDYGLNWYQKSDGLININMGSITDIWNEYREKEKGIPDEQELEDANIDIDNIVLLENDYIKNTHPNLDLDNLKKGYATDQVIEMLKLLKLDKYIINVGNIIVTGDYFDKTGKYALAIASPFKDNDNLLTTLRLTNKVVVSTSLYQKYYHYDDKDYSLIINPKTRKPSDTMIGITVVGDNVADTEAISTMLFLMEIEKGQDYVAKHDELEAIWAFIGDAGQEADVISKNFYTFH